jgi:nicotinate-nucleotide--dimethylbenzimidazole phosphoribosyltransferase
MRLPAIPPLDLEAGAAARVRQDTLTKPRGSLARLEDLALQLAAITGEARPSAARKCVIVMAADHGVVEERVSLYPSDVTVQMLSSFVRGGAAINVLARQAGARVTVVNAGARSPVSALAGAAFPPGAPVRAVDAPIAPGTANMARGPAMTRDAAEAAIALGIRTLDEEAGAGLDLAATGDMGIGNTTAAAAVTAALTGVPPGRAAGRGTGLDDDALARKIAVIERALAVNHPDPSDPIDVARKVGGLEIAALAGVIIGAAARRIPVVLDGFISGAAALIACGLLPAAAPYLIASHESAEPGHAVVLERLGLVPLLRLGLRLGEGTGAALAFHLVEAASRIHSEMATFAEAGVSEKEAAR